MNDLTAQQLAALAQQLAGIAAIFNPAAATTVGAVVGIGTQLWALLEQIKANNPEVWEQVRSDYVASVAGFEASVAANRAKPQG